ncbi:hypothetical protein C5167_017341 [Papaver somniferum]|uniref:Uncharacterized protein n=1 Tax=Papaver somniferum TaxID=3469 RepID=A0A4Y7IN88_PAPSO|nr:hypothetical protein C5167_017341 [Papaver somniferum]
MRDGYQKKSKSSSHGLRIWLGNGSISRAKLKTFMQMMFAMEVVMESGETASQKESLAQ